MLVLVGDSEPLAVRERKPERDEAEDRIDLVALLIQSHGIGNLGHLSLALTLRWGLLLHTQRPISSHSVCSATIIRSAG